MPDHVDPNGFLVTLLRQLGHDMRVPINTLISTTDMLEQGLYDPLTPKQQKAIDRLQRNHHRLLAMLDDFLTYIKANAGDMRLETTPFDPRALTDKAINSVKQMADEKQVVIKTMTTERVPEKLLGDAQAISRILLALLWNAVAYTSVGSIDVMADWTATAEWSIIIKDTGNGITPDELPHIFEPFWRGEQRPQIPTACAGLGLPLARALSELMRGRLLLTETSSEGSTFCLSLPCVPQMNSDL